MKIDIHKSKEFKIRFFILAVLLSLSSIIVYLNVMYGSVKYHDVLPVFKELIYLDGMVFNPFDFYISWIENFIIFFGYGVSLKLLIDILMICEKDTKNINTMKDKYNKRKIFGGNKNDKKSK